jgi:cell wall-associated NlpC family hydrolase
MHAPSRLSARRHARLSVRLRAWGLACAAAGVMGMAQAQTLPAAPAAEATTPQPAAAGQDAVLELLKERGLVQDAMASPLVRQVRDRASEMVVSAMHFLGVPYRRGGNSEEDGFDCSGFTRHVFEHSIGLVLPRRADEQARLGLLQQVRREELKPGDLVFFNTMRRAFSHVGIYVGDGKFIHAPRSGAKVRVEDMRTAYWQKRYNGARRAPNAVLGAESEARVTP